MKIGIVTFHRAHNCGAALQCVALKTVLERMGKDVVVVDNNTIGDGFKFKSPAFTWNPLRFVWRLFRCVGRWYEAQREPVRLRYRSFRRDFIRDIKPGVPVDVYIVGSDQVFNPNIIGNQRNAFLLPENGTPARTCAYGASFGVKTLPESCRGPYRLALQAFSSISVRENAGVRICTEELSLDKKIPVVLDPTLLLKENDYLSVETPYSVDGDYIFVYWLGQDYEGVRKRADELSRRTGLKVVFGTLRWLTMPQGTVALSPGELLYLARNAKFILTTSFHGTVFAILFHKPFLSLVSTKSEGNNRITDLLDKLGLNDHVKSTDSSLPPELPEPNYADVEKKLDQLRGDSLNVLKCMTENLA
jgi:hypothetical protein